MVQEHALGRIVEIRDTGEAVILAALPNLNHALDRQYDSVEIILPDGRRITAKQRAKIYALIGEIAYFVAGKADSQTVEEIKAVMKWEFCLARMESQERRLFSLSDVDETTAREFIDYLVAFVVENGIPTKVPLAEQCEDVSRYVYICAINKKCCVCGRAAELHHVDAVGMGNDRDEIEHIGRKSLPLCGEHHIMLHNIGNNRFMTKYHVEPVKIDEKLVKIYKLRRKGCSE